MPLPDLIEIVPLEKPVRAEITVPGSKSITNRTLILAALSDGETILQGALWSEDTQIMVKCLQELGFMVNVEPDPNEICNRTITVYGNGGAVPRGGTEAQPLDLFVGNAGTAARFLAPFLCLGSGVYRLRGVPRMHERPQAALFTALRELGYRVESEKGNDKLPVKIFGEGVKKGKCRVSIEESSQFASALLLSAKHGGWEIEIVGENAEESPYVAMTSKLIEAFPKGGEFQIEPDASSSSYFFGAMIMAPGWRGRFRVNEIGQVELDTDSEIYLRHNPNTGWQIDEAFPQVFAFALQGKPASRATDIGDSIMTAIVLGAYLGKVQLRFTDLARLRVQECERVKAMFTELKKCGANIEEDEVNNILTIQPSNLHEPRNGDGTTTWIETYEDHRMAMCFAVLGLKVPGIKIKNPACVKKTFPNFFQKLAAQPPHGLGAEIWEIKNGQHTRKLSGEDLFAD